MKRVVVMLGVGCGLVGAVALAVWLLGVSWDRFVMAMIALAVLPIVVWRLPGADERWSAGMPDDCDSDRTLGYVREARRRQGLGSLRSRLPASEEAVESPKFFRVHMLVAVPPAVAAVAGGLLQLL